MGGATGCCNAQPDETHFQEFCMANASHQYLPILTNILQSPLMQTHDQIQGDWHDQAVKTGRGVIFSPGKFYYEGEIVEGKAQGKGRIIWQSRTIYEGAVTGNKANGSGVLKLSEEDTTLRGEWNQGQPALHSKMELVTHNETLFITFMEIHEQQQSIESAKAEITFANGSIYHGQVKRKRDGQFKIDGEGRLRFADGSQYSGGFEGGKMHGRGKYVWADTGHWFEGQYKSNFRDGNGTYYYSSDRSKTGIWKAGHLQIQ